MGGRKSVPCQFPLSVIAWFRNTCAPTMVPSLWPRIYANGWLQPELRLPTSNLALPGRTATVKASTQSCGMNF